MRQRRLCGMKASSFSPAGLRFSGKASGVSSQRTQMECSFSSSRGYSIAMIEDFQHVCITCRDLQASIRFYERISLKVIEPVSELNEEAIARAFRTPKG